MKYLIAPVAVALLASLACLAGPASSEDGATPTKGPNMQEMMEKMAEAAKTGPRHEAMKYFLGDWDVQISMMGMAPTAGKATFTWAIEGRWLMQKLNATMMGKPYELVTLNGYDMYAKAFVTASVHNMDSSMNISRGPVADPSHKMTVQYGFLHEYMTRELYKPYKAVTKQIDENTFTLDVWDLGIGEGGRVVFTYKYTRAK